MNTKSYDSFFQNKLEDIKQYPITAGWVLVALLAVITGLYFRIDGIGLWPLAIDEFFISRSVDNILKHGLPQFDCGGYYVRGIVYQYLVALVRLFDVSPEIATRSISTASYVLALPALYILAKRLSGNIVACAVLILFSLSIWEIEFSRFGRMYAIFQTYFLWYLVFLCRAVIDTKNHARIILYSFSILGVMLWEGGIFILFLNFIPDKFKIENIRWRELIVPCLLIFVAYQYLSTNFRMMGEVPSLPTDVEQFTPSVSTEDIGAILFLPSLLASKLWLALSLIPLLLSCWIIFKFARKGNELLVLRAYLVLVLLLSIANQFGLVVWMTIAFLLYDPLSYISFIRRNWNKLVTIISIWLSFWILYFFNSQIFYQFFPGEESSVMLRKLIVTLIKFPNVFDRVIFVWQPVMPIFTIMLVVVSVAFIARMISIKNSAELLPIRILLFSSLIMIFLLAFITTSYINTRYSFFMYPVLLLFVVYVIYMYIEQIPKAQLQTIILASCMMGVMGASNDWSVGYLLKIKEYSTNFRMNFTDDGMSEHYVLRRDIGGPADFISSNRNSNDKVIITDVSMDQYLENVDYVYRNYQHTEFESISCKLGQTERWSNKPLIYKQQELENIISDRKSDVWIVLRNNKRTFEVALFEKYQNYLVFTSQDKRYDVLRVSYGDSI